MTESSMGIGLFRVLAMVSIFCVKLMFGSAPLYFKTNIRFLSISNAFAAGVFLAGGLIHLLPEAVEAFMGMEQSDDDHGSADHHHHHHCEKVLQPFIICGIGFLCTFYLEKVLMAKPEQKKESYDQELGGIVHTHSHGGETAVIQKFASGDQSIMPVILTAVLSVHSVVSGMALGIQSDSSKAFLIFLAIISHKWVEAFSLGTNIVRATSASIPILARLLLAFSVSSPLGIAIGWLLEVSLHGGNADFVTACLDAAASGTFVYIAVVDTLTEEFANGRDRHQKFLAAVCGFAMMHRLGGLVKHSH
eukprot:TRINITY_DN23654_c0_g1_i1.p1 TRINITY_DN23654_c0_g1~~TRINITY_DN23654_c0_g1_i1.p1  ORF type:complete len:331 (+),score=53.31 TRINITY_DN23654_c0_g1_i1:81-995(+)